MIPLPIVDMEKTGHNIERLRRNRGLRVADIQNMIGFTSPQAVYKWEHGQSFPSLENLVALSHIFGCTIEDIIAVSYPQPYG